MIMCGFALLEETGLRGFGGQTWSFYRASVSLALGCSI